MLLDAVLDEFCGDARLSLEGDLSQCDLRGIPILANESMGVLERSTLFPSHGFVVLPLATETLGLIKQRIIRRVGIRSRVWHVLIEKGGKLVFYAYDQFNPDSVWICAEVTEDFLESLVAMRAISGYSPLAS